MPAFRLTDLLLLFLGVLVIVGLSGAPSRVQAQERERWPEELGCATVEFTLGTIASLFEATGIPGASKVSIDPETGDVTITSVAPGIPTSLNHLFKDGCLYETWEEPLERLPARGTPA